MNLKSFLLTSLVGAWLCSGCDNEKKQLTPDHPNSEQTTPTTSTTDGSFSQALVSGNKFLPATDTQAWATLMSQVDPAHGKALNDLFGTVPNTNEYNEMKQFADELVKGSKDHYEKVQRLIQWIRSKVKYSFDQAANNDPYVVFHKHEAVCQGYSDLLKVFCHTQGIPALVVNGMLKGVGGHAWCTFYADKRWWVCDPTNNVDIWPINADGKYKGSYGLLPRFMVAPIHHDKEFRYAFRLGTMCVVGIESTASTVTLPQSVLGFYLTALHLDTPLSPAVKTLRLGPSYRTLGDFRADGLEQRAPGLEAIVVATENTTLHSAHGVLYQQGSTTPYYIPSAIRTLRLRPIEKVEKDWITHLEQLEELYFAEGTQEIQSSAVYACPKLKQIHIPKATRVDAHAFTSSGGKVEVVRY